MPLDLHHDPTTCPARVATPSGCSTGNLAIRAPAVNRTPLRSVCGRYAAVPIGSELCVVAFEIGIGTARIDNPRWRIDAKAIGRRSRKRDGPTIDRSRELRIRCASDRFEPNDRSADHAICMFSTLGMIQGTENRRRCLCHGARALRPGGTFVLHVHRRWAALRERGGWRRLLRSRIDSLLTPDVEFGDATYAYRGLADMFMHRFSLAELREDLRDSGWQVDRVDGVDLTGEQLTDSTWNSSGFLLVCRSGKSIE